MFVLCLENYMSQALHVHVVFRDNQTLLKLLDFIILLLTNHYVQLIHPVLYFYLVLHDL